MNLQIPGDAFSDGQVRSKLWLAKNLELWNQLFLQPTTTYIFNWYGSWIGLGPFMVLSLTSIKVSELNLIELDQEALRNSEKLLEHWRIEGLKINFLNTDMNHFSSGSESNQIFFNTSCEHVLEMDWLQHISKDCFVLLQSTNMVHEEHINCPKNLADFQRIYSPYVDILDLAQIDFIYPGKSFQRFMLFGRKCN